MDILPQLIANSIIAGSIYMLVALGFNLVFSTVKFFDLGYGVLATVGAYSVFYLSKTAGLGNALSIPLGVIAGGLMGFLIYRLVYSPLRKRKASNMVMLVASLGVFTAIQAIIAILFTSQFQTLYSNTWSSAIYSFGGATITSVQLTILLAGLGVLLFLALLLKFTMFGKAVKAVGDDEEVSKIVGINTGRIIGGVFFIGGAIAGLAGILVGFDTGIEPTMGLPLLLKGVIASIVGGIGNVYGSVLGGFLLGFVENFGIWQISGEWKDAIAFSLLIVFLLWRPKGILPR